MFKTKEAKKFLKGTILRYGEKHVIVCEDTEQGKKETPVRFFTDLKRTKVSNDELSRRNIKKRIVGRFLRENREILEEKGILRSRRAA